MEPPVTDGMTSTFIAPEKEGLVTITVEVLDGDKVVAMHASTVRVSTGIQSTPSSLKGLPKISITRVPEAEPPEGTFMGTIQGKVSGVSPKDTRVVLYAHTDAWYVQPNVASPFTEIDADGSWETEVHLAVEYAALLVDTSFRPHARMSELPPLGREVKAISRQRPKR